MRLALTHLLLLVSLLVLALPAAADFESELDPSPAVYIDKTRRSDLEAELLALEVRHDEDGVVRVTLTIQDWAVAANGAGGEVHLMHDPSLDVGCVVSVKLPSSLSFQGRIHSIRSEFAPDLAPILVVEAEGSLPAAPRSPVLAVAPETLHVERSRLELTARGAVEGPIGYPVGVQLDFAAAGHAVSGRWLVTGFVHSFSRDRGWATDFSAVSVVAAR